MWHIVVRSITDRVQIRTYMMCQTSTKYDILILCKQNNALTLKNNESFTSRNLCSRNLFFCRVVLQHVFGDINGSLRKTFWSCNTIFFSEHPFRVLENVLTLLIQ